MSSQRCRFANPKRNLQLLLLLLLMPAGSLDPSVIATVVGALYTDEAVAADIRRAESAPESRLLVVVSGDRADGVPRVDGFLHYDELGPEPELHRIYLRPTAIGTGAGSALMRALHESLALDRRYVLLVVKSALLVAPV